MKSIGETKSGISDIFCGRERWYAGTLLMSDMRIKETPGYQRFMQEIVGDGIKKLLMKHYNVFYGESDHLDKTS